ncbi:MAG: endonuclease MutS2, partial [Chitinophagaceae bacterium]
MSIFPDSALHQLEFNKIGELLEAHAQSAYAKEKARRLRIHTRKEYIELELQQSHEYKLLLQAGLSTPNDQVVNLEKELKLLAIPGAVFSIEQCVQVRKLLEETKSVFQWFQPERRINYAGLAQVLEGVAFEKKPLEEIQAVLEEQGGIRDNASAALLQIRSSLSKKRSEVRRVFDRVIQKWSKAGYVADVEEAFLNGRRVIAVTAEHKRQVKGILLGESDTRKTAFLEPEETIELNNDVLELEGEESREVYRILRQLTETLSRYTPLLQAYHRILGELDFIRAKARLALDLNGNLPRVSDVSRTALKEAYHPLLIMLHKDTPKLTVPINLKLDDQHRILVISGPNAGGKTVTLKTVGLLQLMAQSGLLIPVHPDSEIGIYKKLMIHIGDTQSLEFELSTYSSHLKNMKHFIEESTGRTLFFIDELGSGSDPSLGGAFAEVILEELVRKHAQGIVTTHYLNLKIMAGKTPGIQNAAMAFDEKNLLPLFQLIIGKPGSSYTFSIAERIGLDPRLIGRARQLVDEGHFRLDKLLNKTEQEWQQAGQRNRELKELLEQNEKLKKEL